MAAVIVDQTKHSELNAEHDFLGEKGHSSDHSHTSDTVSKHEDEYQRGVRQARAITAVWNKQTLWLMFFLLFTVSFVDLFLVAVQTSLNPYITSEFGRHGLLATVSIVPTIIAGTARLTIAKIIDLAGRIEGFIAMLLLAVIGCIIKATSQNIETYIVAHTLFWTGHLGLMYVIDVMCSDMTTLRNRSIILSINYTPIIATTFAGPKVAQMFYQNVNFRWAFGAFAIILIGVCLPVIVVMLWAQRAATKSGALVKRSSGRSWWQTVKHIYIQMDVTGILLLTLAFALFLLPFSLAAYAPKGWKTGYIIAMLVLGLLFFPAFYIWERYFSPVQFLKWQYLLDPTILGSCFLYAFFFTSIFCWNTYMNSYMQVVYRLNIANSGYVLNSLSLTSAIFAPFVAWLIRATGKFKWIAFGGVPIFLLGTALMIPFRAPGVNVGLVALTQILIGLASAVLTTCVQLAVMVPVTHQEIAAVLAILGLFGSIGSGIGISISGAIWNNMLREKLRENLPEASKNLTPAIFADIKKQLAYAWGTPEREAIVTAYGIILRYMCIAGICFVPLCLVCIWVWKDVNVKKIEETEEDKQTRGTVW